MLARGGRVGPGGGRAGGDRGGGFGRRSGKIVARRFLFAWTNFAKNVRPTTQRHVETQPVLSAIQTWDVDPVSKTDNAITVGCVLQDAVKPVIQLMVLDATETVTRRFVNRVPSLVAAVTLMMSAVTGCALRGAASSEMQRSVKGVDRPRTPMSRTP